MKTVFSMLLTLLLVCTSCGNDDNSTIQATNITFNFNHDWDGNQVTNTNFNTLDFTNENGEKMSITKLRYLISDIVFTDENDIETRIDGYNLVDVTNAEGLSFTATSGLANGTYKNVSFTFGFNNNDNYQNYTDLNSASWNVPSMLGGGYHFLQLEGKFIDSTNDEVGYAYHAIRAVDNSVSPQKFQDTFFEVNLGEVTISNNTVFNINMNIAEWFKGPNTWDLNVLNNMLMPNFDAQVMMFENGQNVFSLEP
ncbi:MbnP family protein [uncultured Algibacter sp.]|uniref:MbnP family protein n=1 Tax=uncultured Algibacter sp. TaxID=298659 RepID=UPI003217FB48